MFTEKNTEDYVVILEEALDTCMKSKYMHHFIISTEMLKTTDSGDETSNHRSQLQVKA